MTKISELHLGRRPSDITNQAVSELEGRLNEVIRALNGLELTGNGTPGEQGPAGKDGAAGVAGVAGTNGSTFLPETVSFLVPEAAPGVWSVGEVTVHKKSLLLRVSSDQSCIFRCYFNADLRDIDAGAGRLPTTNPGPGFILAEVGLDLANGRTQFLSPVPVIYNADDPFTSTIYWAVMQTMLVDVAVNVELYILPLED